MKPVVIAPPLVPSDMDASAESTSRQRRLATISERYTKVAMLYDINFDLISAWVIGACFVFGIAGAFFGLYFSSFIAISFLLILTFWAVYQLKSLRSQYYLDINGDLSESEKLGITAHHNLQMIKHKIQWLIFITGLGFFSACLLGIQFGDSLSNPLLYILGILFSFMISFFIFYKDIKKINELTQDYKKEIDKATLSTIGQDQ
jgi:hypothetical protein